MREHGVGVNLHYIPVHTQPYYRDMGFSVGDYPEAEKYYNEAITLPIYPGLNDAQQERVVSILTDAIQS
jgi:dTDP-4-amino-4,6-dideoxygalactose transaminase